MINPEVFLTIEGFVDSNGSGGSSGSVAPAITAPDTLLATADADSIVLTWNNGQVYDAVHIERKDSGAYAELAIIAGTLTTYDDTSALVGVAYTYRVRGRVQVSRYSAYSNESSATISAGGTPHSANFNGIDGYLSTIAPASLAINDTDSVIIGMWVKIPDVTIPMRLLGKFRDSNNTNPNYILEISTDTEANIFFFARTGTSGSSTIDSVETLSNNTKYFLLAWKDVAGNTINISVNAATETSTGYTAGIATDANGDFQLGLDASNNEFYSGILDEVFVCKNPASIANAITLCKGTIYNSGTGLRYSGLSAGNKTTLGLVSWWGLDETSGNRLDLHGVNNLTVTGGVTSDTALVS